MCLVISYFIFSQKKNARTDPITKFYCIIRHIQFDEYYPEWSVYSPKLILKKKIKNSSSILIVVIA